MTQPSTQEEVRTAAPAKRKPGRPRRFELWFVRVARTMRDGTSMRNALIANRINVSAREIKNLYKNLAFQRLYKIERYLYLNRDSSTPFDVLRRFASERLFSA
jgi:hypothetical protein